MSQGLYEELSYSVIGAAQEVHRLLRPGFLETVYEQALAYELELRKIAFERQSLLRVMYKDRCVGEYRADFVVDNRIIVELKAVPTMIPVFESQTLHYLAATGLRLALLMNFGAASLKVRRLIR